MEAGKAYRARLPRPDSESELLDSKIFLTVIYEYRYKLCCIVNVTGKSVNKLGNVTAKG